MKRTLLTLTLALAVSAVALEPMERPLIIAHRGDSQIAPENTMVAIESAIAVNADLIEFDVRTTLDGDLLLFHDTHMERYGGSKNQHFDELSTAVALTIDVGSVLDPRFSSERAPTFEAAIERILKSESIPLIERKSGTPAQYLEVLDALEAREKVIVQSFDWNFLTELKGLAPDLKLGALGSKALKADRLAQLETLQPDWVGWNQRDLTAGNIDALHERGFRVAVWTINDLARVRKFIADGADAIITDRPGEMLELVQ